MSEDVATPPVVSEAQFQVAVCQLARLRGWRCAHLRPAMTKRGWRTPVSWDGAGFPDAVLTRRGRLVFVEFKGARGRLSGEQERWLDALRMTAAETYLWTLSDLPEIEKVLA